MRSILKSWVFPMVLLCFGASTAWAAFGPCVIYRLKGLGPSQPIGCYKFWQNITYTCRCAGELVIIPEASWCRNTNTTPCSEVQVPLLESYETSGTCMTWVVGYPFPLPLCGGTCVVDPKSKWPTWGTDTACLNPVLPPVNPNPPVNSNQPMNSESVIGG
jgi:hypothetical protein